jgi:hypothetical protein
MKYFMIKYQFKGGSEEEWHREIGRFVAALESDPVLKGKISYRSTKHKGGTDYYHLAAAADEQAVKALEDRDFFSRFKEQTKIASGGGVEVLPLEIIAETEAFERKARRLGATCGSKYGPKPESR